MNLRHEADVVKTRVMNDRSKDSGKALMHFKSSYLRIGPHTVISFILIEKVRQLFGMQTY